MICPVCNSGNTFFWGEVTRFKTPFSIRRCSNCKSAYQFPTPINPHVFYDKDYYSGQANFSYLDERKIEKYSKFVWDARIKNLKKFHKEGIFIDVGCAFGGFTRSASSTYQAYGIDISAYAVEQGNAFSLENNPSENFCGLYHGDLLDFPVKEIKKGTVSIISMIEVVEHLENPVSHLKEAYKLLKPGGILLLQTANITAYQAEKAGLNYHYYLPGHLTYFSEEGLEILINDLGFSYLRKFFPVEFGLLPKLKKMCGSFSHTSDYFRWIKTSAYHCLSFFRYKGQPLTSSLVIYAIK